jgi:hypothetical protein
MLLANFVYPKGFYIIKIEDDKAYLDIVKGDTITSKTLTVFSRPEKIIHPNTKKEIEISKNLGTIVLLEVKDSYATALIPENMKNRVEPGQKIEFSSSEAMDTSALAFNDEIMNEMGKLRHSFMFNSVYNSVNLKKMLDGKDKFYGFDMTYRYNFLLSYLYFLQLTVGYLDSTYDDGIEKNPKFIYSKASFEWKLGNIVSFITTGRVGLKETGIGYGFDTGLRFGKPFKTNVLVGGGIVEDFGKYMFLTLNGKIKDGVGLQWLTGTFQVDNFPINLRSETFRIKIGGIFGISDTINLHTGVYGSGQNTQKVGVGGDLSLEFKF